MATQNKAKRKLSNISFEKEGAHVALVGKSNGGPANGHDYALLMKSNFSQEFLEKASEVKVTMEITEFLRRMFYMYYEDAEILARALGFTTAAMDMAALDAQEEQLDAAEQAISPEAPDEPEGSEYEQYIAQKLQAFEVMKSLHDSKSFAEQLSKLDEDQYLTLLKDQAAVEKAFRKIERAEKALLRKESNVAAKAVADDTSIASEVKDKEVSASVNKANTSGVGNVNKETSMTKEVQVEMVEKSQLESVMKAQEALQTELQKARDLLAQFEAEKKEAIAKARKEALEKAMKDGAKAEVLFKAVKDSSDEDFQAVVNTLSEIQSVIEKSALFQEQGASVEDEAPVIQESAVAKVLKAKLVK